MKDINKIWSDFFTEMQYKMFMSVQNKLREKNVDIVNRHDDSTIYSLSSNWWTPPNDPKNCKHIGRAWSMLRNSYVCMDCDKAVEQNPVFDGRGALAKRCECGSEKLMGESSAHATYCPKFEKI